MRTRMGMGTFVAAAAVAAFAAGAAEAKGPRYVKNASTEVYDHPCFGYYPTTWREFPGQCAQRAYGAPGCGDAFAETRAPVAGSPYGAAPAQPEPVKPKVPDSGAER